MLTPASDWRAAQGCRSPQWRHSSPTSRRRPRCAPHSSSARDPVPLRGLLPKVDANAIAPCADRGGKSTLQHGGLTTFGPGPLQLSEANAEIFLLTSRPTAPQTSMAMAHKWTKASRAKLSRSQKARWRKRKRQRRQNR
jgi:hypothetical protein